MQLTWIALQSSKQLKDRAFNKVAEVGSACTSTLTGFDCYTNLCGTCEIERSVTALILD